MATSLRTTATVVTLTSPRRQTWRVSLTWLLAAVLALPPMRPAAAIEPMTMMLVASIASTALQLGANKHDISGQIAMETLNLVKELHARMDNVERTLSFVAQEVARLPEQMRQAVTDGINLDRTMELLGVVATTQGLLDGVETAKKKARSQLPQRLTELRSQIVHLRNLRNAAFLKNDFMAPAIFAALVTEVTALTQLREYAAEVPSALAEYDARIAQMLDDQRPGGLSYFRKALEELQPAAELQIAKAIVPAATAPLNNGTYDWFMHSLQTAREAREESLCHEIDPKFTWYKPDGIDWAQAKEGRLDLVRQVRCWKKVTVHDDIHTRDLKRTFSRDFIANYPDIYTLRLAPTKPVETKGYRQGATRHLSADDAYEKPFNARHNELMSRIAIFNARAQAIVYLKELEQAASAARVLIARWETPSAKQVVEISLELSSSGASPLTRVSQIAREAVADEQQAAMLKAAAQAHEQIANADKRIEEVIREARKDKWRQDLLVGLEVFKIALTIQMAVSSEINTQRAKQAPAFAGATPAAEAQNSTATPKAQATPAPQQATTPAKSTNDTSIGPRRINPVERIEQILRTVDKRPAKSWDKLPSSLTPEEMSLIEGLALLQKMPKTAADKMLAEQSTGAEIFGDVIKALATGRIEEAKKKVLLNALKPTMLAGGTADDLLHRLWMHRELTERMGAFLSKRYKSDFMDQFKQTDPCRVQACWQRAR